MLQLVKNQREKLIKHFQRDGGTEFGNSELRNLFKSNRVIICVTNPYTPQQNACVERTSRRAVDLPLTMLLSKSEHCCFYFK